MNQIIYLKSERTLSLVLGIISLGLGILILYWGIFVKMNLEVSGAELDPATSAILAVLISIGPVLAGINLIIRFFSLGNYGDFAIVMDDTHISFPVKKFMRGYSRFSIEKSKLYNVRVDNRGTNDATLFLNNEQRVPLAVIPNTMVPYHQMSGMQLAEKIQAWMNHGRY